KAIMDADAILIGPGDLFSSLLPNLVVKGMKQAIGAAKGKKIYFVNIMTKFGETNGFQASDFINTVENYLGKGVLHYAVINKTKPTLMRFKPYAKENAQCVEVDMKNLPERPMPIVSDLLRKSGFIRHDPDKVIEVVRMLI
ncbi:MAG: 2-phospho-L-lactate transferase CofD family protein, partial [bacterium]|nr:2-phospho-L-lactate transferase CofD family protein [bacterium]